MAEEVSLCASCSTNDDFRLNAIGKAYSIGTTVPAGTYYPWIYVVNFKSGVVKRYEVLLEVMSDQSEPFVTIPDINASISAELQVDSFVQQDVSMAKDIADTVQDIDVDFPPIFYFFGGENVFDFLGNQNAYNDMELAYRSQLMDARGWVSFSALWIPAMALEFASFLSPFQSVSTVEFRDGSVIRFFLTPQLSQAGQMMGFSFEFKAAFDADGNEVFEDPEIYVGETFTTDLGENFGGGLPTSNQVPLLSYLSLMGEVTIVDGRGAFGCIRTVVVTTCTDGPDGGLTCVGKVQCN